MDDKTRKEVEAITDNCQSIMQEVAQKLDLNNLEKTLASNYALFERATRDLPYIGRLLGAAKNERDSLYARTYLTARAAHESAGKKPTETMIRSEVHCDPAYGELLDDILILEEAHATLSSAAHVFREKTFAIKAVVDLYKHEYWAITTNP